jgi:hypothetical protein
LLEPINGAQIAGDAGTTPPSLNTCKAALLDDAAVGMRAGAYLCFLTNSGKYGFFLESRPHSTGVVFDAYVFP